MSMKDYTYRMLSRINREEADTYEKCRKDGTIIKHEVYDNGVFLVEDFDNTYYALLSFEGDVQSYTLVHHLCQELEWVIANKGQRKHTLIINGENRWLMHFVAFAHYNLHNIGYEYRISRENAKEDAVFPAGIVCKGYEEDKVPLYARCLDEAFEEQDKISGECNEGMAEKTQNYCKEVCPKADARGDFYAFWQGENLIGLCLCEGDLLDSFVISPAHQGKGIGKTLLTYCLSKRFENDSRQEVFLYTYYSNIRAQNLYAKSGMERTGFYAIFREKG